jgi:hypothetical protein
MRGRIFLICLLLTSIFSSEVYGVAIPENLDGVSFQFFINPVAGPEEVMIEISFINDGEKTIDMEAATSQWYEITILNQKDEIVYQFSEGRSFLQAFQHLSIKPGETKTWIQNIKNIDGTMLAPGKYKVIVQLLPYSINGVTIKGTKIMDQKEMVVPKENPIIKNVKINKNHVSGEARPYSGMIYYVVEDGHHEWISETKMNVGKKFPTWGKFTFELKLPKNKKQNKLPLILYLYEKDDKGNIIHSYPKIIKQ